MSSSQNSQKNFHHTHRHFGFSYPVSVFQRFYSLVVFPLFFVVLSVVLLKLLSIYPSITLQNIPFSFLVWGLVATLIRLFIAYVFALVVAILLVLLINTSQRLEAFFLPVFDIIESVPVLAFFPIIILLFIHFQFFNGAAIFILFLAMLWNIVFSVLGGSKIIPADIKSAAHVFHIKGFAYIRKVFLPAVFPHIVTGSLLAWAQGWNIIIVAEVLHTYIPGGTSGDDLFGIGSILVHAASGAQNNLFVATIVLIILAIAFMNFFIWQKLLRLAERYRFE